MCDYNHLIFAYTFRFYHYSKFSSRLHGIRFFNSLIRICYCFKIFKSFYIIFQRLSSCSRSCCGNRIRRLNYYGFNRLCFDISVMSFYTVNYFPFFLVFFSKLYSKFNMSSFHFMIYGFTYIM